MSFVMVSLSLHLQGLHVKQPHQCAHCVSENTKVVHGNNPESTVFFLHRHHNAGPARDGRIEYKGCKQPFLCP